MAATMTLPIHPLAKIFPPMEGLAFDQLVTSIKANGLRDAITVHNGMVLDGRNRQNACEVAAVDCLYEPLESDSDPLQFIIDKNLKRCHLNDDQRRVVAANIANLGRGRPSETPAECGIKVADAALMVNVDEAGTERARTMLAHAEPEVKKAVERGKLSVNAAVQATKFAPETQRKIAAEAEAGRANVVRNVIKQEHRDNRERVLATCQKALPNKKYGLIYVDIPRRFKVHSRDTGLDRAPENHYPTMTFDECLKLPVAELAAPASILINWSTPASLLDDIDIMAEWGFVTLRPRITNGKLVRDGDGNLVDPHEGGGRYCSMQVWDKVNMGLGYWFRDRHEFILVAVRGDVVPPAQGTQDQSLFSEAKGTHSAKPERVAEMIDRLWPNLPKIELFARKARQGWDVWGYEVPTETRSPMTDDSTSKHSPSLEPNTTGEPAPVVVTGVGSFSSSGVLV